MKTVNSELKKVVGRIRKTQSQLQTIVTDRTWVEDARKYAERQGTEVKKLLTHDVSKVKSFLEKERKELERFQKQIPSEVKKLRKFVDSQKKEFEKLLSTVTKSGLKTKKKSPRKSTAKKAGTRKTAET